MNQKTLEEIKAREQAATPGPWISIFDMKGFTVFDMIGEKGKMIARLFNSNKKYKRPDADFIAHARTDIPALIAEVERLTTENNALQNAIRKLATQNRRIINREMGRDSQIATLEKTLEEITRIKNDYFSQLQSYIKAFRLHQAALELMCSDLLSAYACPINPENIDLYTKKYIQQAQQTHETQEAEK